MMKNNQPHGEDSADLRRRAEERLREKADQSPQDLASLSPEELLRILHELRVHQIELEMQNEELQRTQLELKSARERYFNLYDLAPVGYVTLSEKGLILEANLTTAGLLGVARGTLVKQPLNRFILKEDQDHYYLCRKQLFGSGEPQGCDLRMVQEDGTAFWAHLTATAAQDEEGVPVCRAVISNISGRKQAEEAVRESENILKDILESTLSGYWDWNLKDNTEYFSPTFKRMFGYEDHEMENSPEAWQKIIFPDDLPGVFEIFDRHVKSRGREPYYNEVRYRHKDGSTVWVICAGRVIQWSADGSPTRMVGCHVNITDRKLAEEALRKSEQSFRALAENSGDYIMRYDHAHRHVYANPRAIQVSGRTSSEFIGKTHRELGFPEDLCALWETAIDKVFATGQSHGEVFQWDSAEGPIVLDWHLFPEMDLQGRVISVLGVSRDITHQLETEQVLAKSEEQFRTLASLAPVGIYLTRPDGSCLYTNPAWQKMAGLGAEEALGNGWVNGIHPDDREMVFSNWQKMVESQGEWGQEYRFVNREGKTTTVFGLASAQKDTSGDIIGYIGVNTDITERKQAELFLKNLVAMNPVSIQVLDTNGFTLEVNPAFKSLFGSVPPADYSLFDDPQLVQQGIWEIFDRLRKGEVVRFPDVYFNPHDSIPELPDVPNWVRTIGFPVISENEKPERFILMQENITKQKNAEVTLRESEYKFRQTFDVSPVGIVMVGLDSRFIDCNRAFSKSLGYETEELIGKRIEEVTLPEDLQIGKAEMMAIVKGEITKSQVQKRYLRKDGQVIWGEVTISLIKDSSGQAQYFLAIIQNITERKLAEQKINDQLAELRRWNNATMGREDRIMELKREVNKLLKEAGKPPHYASVEEEAHG
jgi:PAS domain S-box-containing protein